MPRPKEIAEKLSTYIDRIERLEGQFSSKGIVISSDIREKEILLDGDDDNIEKEPILWRLYEHNMFYVVTVPAGTRVEKHKHDENLFRFIAQGSLTLNRRKKIKAGTWFVVKANQPYEISTDEGYVSLAGYVSRCQTKRGLEGKHLIKRVIRRKTVKKKR